MTAPDPVGDTGPSYEVYAIKYAEADALPVSKLIIGADPHEERGRVTWLISPTEVFRDRSIPAEQIVPTSFLSTRGRCAEPGSCHLLAGTQPVPL